jgi:hypothetical protein
MIAFEGARPSPAFFWSMNSTHSNAWQFTSAMWASGEVSEIDPCDAGPEPLGLAQTVKIGLRRHLFT